MSASSDKSRPSELTGDGLSAVPGNDGRNIGVLALIFGVGGLLMSWMIVGGILGAFGIVLGIIAMAKAMSAKKRVQAAGGRRCHQRFVRIGRCRHCDGYCSRRGVADAVFVDIRCDVEVREVRAHLWRVCRVHL